MCSGEREAQWKTCRRRQTEGCGPLHIKTTWKNLVDFVSPVWSESPDMFWLYDPETLAESIAK